MCKLTPEHRLAYLPIGLTPAERISPIGPTAPDSSSYPKVACTYEHALLQIINSLLIAL